MSGIDGLELQRRVAPTGVPIIFVTANDDPAVREKALAQGAAAYLAKPLNGALLIRAVELALALR
jgi:CheY-like chemotaxis protein